MCGTQNSKCSTMLLVYLSASKEIYHKKSTTPKLTQPPKESAKIYPNTQGNYFNQ